MALPFPHGTSSGQIGHGVLIDTNDVPGSVGGRFVGFGEDGKSRASNRGYWALSTNIDYIYQNYITTRTVPGVKTFTSSGASYYNLTGWTFVGLAGYPTSESIGLPLLFSVLDERWASLGDPELGGEVRVTSVRDTGNVGTVYKLGDSHGFYQNVRLGFSLIDAPTGTVLVANYTIPNNTVVNIIYGAVGNYETLASDALLRVMLNKTGVPAGVILQNGTRKMLGDLDLGVHAVKNVTTLDGGTSSLSFKDLIAHTAVPFSEPVYGTGLNSETPVGRTSLLGKINSVTRGIGHVVPNRFLSAVGDLTFDPVAGTVSLPAASEYVMGSETLYVTDELTVGIPGDDQTYYVVLDHTSGTPALRAIAAPRLDDDMTEFMLLVAWANRKSDAQEFNGQGDLRTSGRHIGGRFEVYVGSDRQCDFTGLQQAVDFVYANYLSLPSSAASTWRPRIVLRGELQVPSENSTVTFPAATPFAWELAGEGGGVSGILAKHTGQATIRGANSQNVATIDVNYNTIQASHLTFVAGSSTSTAKALVNLGDGSTFVDCAFTAPAYGSSLAAAIDQPAGYPIEAAFRSCFFSSITGPAVTATGRLLFEDCAFSAVGANGGNVTATSGECAYLRCSFQHGVGASLSVGLDASDVLDGHVQVEGCTFLSVCLKLVYPTTSRSGQVSVRGNTFRDVTYSGLAGVKGDNSAGSITSGSANGALKVDISGNVFEGCSTSIKFDLSNVETDYATVSIAENNIRPSYGVSSSLTAGIVLSQCGRVTVSSNTLAYCTIGVQLDGSTHGTVVDNHFHNCTTRAVKITSGLYPITVRGNTHMLTELSGTTFAEVIDRDGCVFSENTATVLNTRILQNAFTITNSGRVSITGNKICATSGNTVYASESGLLRVTDNDFQGCGSGAAVVNLADSSGYWVCDNTVQKAEGTAIDGGGVHVHLTAEGTCFGTIAGNQFVRVKGHGPASGDGSSYVIYAEQARETTTVGKTVIDRNTMISCGDILAGNGASIVYIYCSGVCQVNYNMIVDPQWSGLGTGTTQTGISVQLEAPGLWSSVVHGNQILVNNDPGTSGGIVGYGEFIGIDMNQHGSLMGNSIVAANLVVGEDGSSRQAIRVGSGKNVADIGNISHNLGTNVNIVQGMTLGNIGDVNTNGNLSDHATGNTTGA